ncbi:MerR family transcriptional regulator [Microbacterium gorillae]|uniref:MerR family transcriptional regulator n=1 Tax=Microbacterium gorillae TaxID=1231063 RepID=UPI00058CA8DE|nr:MerR family transcriptional regulator [Microbacterium gorillae]
MLIGEFASEAGTTPRMLRHYEDTDLLAPASRDTNGYRIYSPEQLPRARQIQALLASGMPATLVRQLLDVLTDAGGIYPEHVTAETVTAVETEYERMCRCVECMAARRDALRVYLDQLRAD